MKRELKERVIDTIYESLNESGFLILGEAETPGRKMGEKFMSIDGAAKIYRKK
jgi:chemotaxis methyl-accepting protein methylase